MKHAIQFTKSEVDNAKRGLELLHDKCADLSLEIKDHEHGAAANKRYYSNKMAEIREQIKKLETI